MPKDFDKMQSAILKQLVSDFKNKHGKSPSGDAMKELEARSFAVATSQYKKKFGKSPREDFCHDLILTEVADLQVAESNSKDLTLKGTAVKVGVSRNNVEYTATELRKATNSLIGKPFLKDHNTNTVDSIIGKVSNAFFDEKTQSIQFEAKIDKNDPVAEKIRKGYLKNVSIGAGVDDLEEGDEKDIRRAIGIDFHELSAVVVPGVVGAEIASISEKLDYIKRGESMSEELTFATKEDLTALKGDLKELKELLVAKVKTGEQKPEPIQEKSEESKKLLEELRVLKEAVGKLKEDVPAPKGKVSDERIAEMEKQFDKVIVEKTRDGRVVLEWNDPIANKYSAGKLTGVKSMISR